MEAAFFIYEDVTQFFISLPGEFGRLIQAPSPFLLFMGVMRR